MTLKERFPLLYSPRFQGIVITALLFYVRTKGWMDEDTITLIMSIIGGATGVNILDKFAMKVSGVPRKETVITDEVGPLGEAPMKNTKVIEEVTPSDVT